MEEVSLASGVVGMAIAVVIWYVVCPVASRLTRRRG
jgi:hypothetical protein